MTQNHGATWQALDQTGMWSRRRAREARQAEGILALTFCWTGDIPLLFSSCIMELFRLLPCVGAGAPQALAAWVGCGVGGGGQKVLGEDGKSGIGRRGT